MTAFRLMYFTDLHLSNRMPAGVENWEACLDAIATSRPDMVVIGGDLLFEDPDSDADRLLAFELLSRIPVPWRVTPGNHDVGDSLPATSAAHPVTPARLARYREVFGADWWSHDVGPWKLLGLNNMLCGSDLPDERVQEEFVRAELSGWAGPVGLFIHKPFSFGDLDDQEVVKFVMHPTSRRRLVELFGDADLKFVGSGHCHMARDTSVAGARMVWSPSTGIVIGAHPRLPDMTAGWLTYTFEGGEVAIDWSNASALPAIDIAEVLATYGSLPAIPTDVLLAMRGR